MLLVTQRFKLAQHFVDLDDRSSIFLAVIPSGNSLANEQYCASWARSATVVAWNAPDDSARPKYNVKGTIDLSPFTRPV
jgi:hypothetical protein